MLQKVVCAFTKIAMTILCRSVLLLAVFSLFVLGCERHDFESTRVLFEKHGHGDAHAHDDAHGQGKKGESAHGGGGKEGHAKPGAHEDAKEASHGGDDQEEPSAREVGI